MSMTKDLINLHCQLKNMWLMKKSILLIISIFFTYLPLKAQFIPKRWTKVYEDSAKTVYIDTTSIRNRDMQYIFWSLNMLKEPISIERIPDKVYRSKTQYVVNGLTEKYNIIGELYYDKIGKLIGENYNRGLTGAGDAFSKKLSKDPFVGFLLQKVKDYLEGNLETDSTQAVDTGVSDFIAKLKSKAKDSLEQTKKDTVASIPVVENSPVEIKQPEKELTTNQSKEQIKILTDTKKPKVADSGSKKTIKSRVTETLTLKRKTDSTAEKNKRETKKSKKYVYNDKKERNVTKTIFTDGEKFVVQVSSWKNKRIAEKQKNKLIEMGYDAFITQVYIKRKRGTWNRVRVGYFDSLKEAKKVEREIRRKIK